MGWAAAGFGMRRTQMGFLNGRVTFMRYQVGDGTPLPFDDEILDRVEQHAFGKHGGPDPVDGVRLGWAGGEHLLDESFHLEKNVVNDALHLAVRVETDQLPSDLLRAYTGIELEARARDNPSGRPAKAQRQEAKEAAKLRVEAEASDGRFRRRKQVPVLWDGRQNVLYAGTTSPSALDRVLTLFRETFGRELEPITAGRLALAHTMSRGTERDLEWIGPVAFAREETPAGVVWSGGEPSSPDFVGNEFLVWLWHTLVVDGDTIELADRSEVSVMFAKTLTLDCPLGQTGSDSLRDAGPARLPEALRALQCGKLPRKVGLILARQGMQYDLTLQAETLAVTGLGLPKLEDVDRNGERIGRVDNLRHFVETLDLLLGSYVERRTGADWTTELGRIRNWLQAA